MTRNIKDWTITVNEVFDTDYGRGFKAECFIKKQGGYKTNIQVLCDYTGLVKTHTQMLAKAEAYLGLL